MDGLRFQSQGLPHERRAATADHKGRGRSPSAPLTESVGPALYIRGRRPKLRVIPPPPATYARTARKILKNLN